MTKVWCLSDTHGLHHHINPPDGTDIAIFAGDESNSRNPHQNAVEARNFLEWYSDLDIPVKVFVPGNHSTAIARKMILPEDYPNIIFLLHEAKVIKGWKFYGSPWTPRFNDWAYNYKPTVADLVWRDIPDDTDILITHGPPRGVLDLAEDMEDRKRIVQVGCKCLWNKVAEVEPLLHVFGHVHGSKTLRNTGMARVHPTSTIFVNAATINNDYQMVAGGVWVPI